VVVAGLAALGACGDDGEPEAATTTEAPTTTGDTTTSTPSVRTSTTGGSATTELPGEDSDIGPAEGEILGVVGVAHDDVLNVRDGPGTANDVIATLAPLADDVEATGRHRYLAGPPGSFWWEVSVDGSVGWANAAFLAWLGATDDATAGVVARLGGRPTADTMEQLGRIVAESQASTDDPESAITLTVAPTVGDLGEVTFDVVGLADDSVLGVRVHVFGDPSGGAGFVLDTVELTVLCGRGADDDGLCV